MTMQRTRRLVWGGLTATLCSLAALAAAATLALAHGGAELTVAPAAVAPGGAVTVKADGVEADATFTVSLAGPQFKSVLGVVKTTQDTFEQGFTIPADAPADSYQVQALGADGDVISADLAVSAGASTAGPVESKEPTAAPMQLDRSKPALQTAIIASAAIISVILGVVLLRPGRRAA